MNNYIFNSAEQISSRINVSDNQLPQIVDRLGNEIRVISTKFCKASFFDTIDLVVKSLKNSLAILSFQGLFFSSILGLPE